MLLKNIGLPVLTGINMAMIPDILLVCICYYKICFYQDFAFEVIIVLMLWVILRVFLSTCKEEREKMLVLFSSIPDLKKKINC